MKLLAERCSDLVTGHSCERRKADVLRNSAVTVSAWGLFISLTRCRWTLRSPVDADMSRCSLTCNVDVFFAERHYWNVLNRFWTDTMPQVCFAKSAVCECEQKQTINRTVDIMRPLIQSEDGLQSLHDVGDDALSWLETIATTALVKWIKKLLNWKSQFTTYPWLPRILFTLETVIFYRACETLP